MSIPIKLKTSVTPGAVPSVGDLISGELAVNVNDGKLFLKKTTVGVDSIQRIGPVDSVAGRQGDVILAASDISYRVRTVTSRLDDAINAKDYGAVGDNTTNDTTAIQAAINAAAAINGTVFVPSGKYKIGQLTFPSGLKGFTGAGIGSTTFNVTGSFTAFSPILFFNGMTDFYVGNFSFSANIVTYATNHAMQLGACSDGVVENIHMTSGAYIGIYAPACVNVTFNDIAVDEVAVSVFVADTNPSRLVINNLRNLSYGTGVGVSFTGGSWHRISDSYIAGAGSDYFPISLNLCNDSTVTNCTAIGINREGIQITDGSRNQILDSRVFCLGGHTDFGISIFSNTVDIRDNLVDGCTIVAAGGPGIGVSASYTPSVKICFYNTISNNLIVNPYQSPATPTTGCGIQLLGGATCTANIIQNNTIFDETNKVVYGVHEWDSGGNPTNNKLIHNPCFAGAAYISEGYVVGSLSEVYDLGWVTFTTALSASTGTLTTGSATLKYKRHGRSADISATFSITTNGTGAGRLILTVPFNIVNGVISGVEAAVSGKMLVGYKATTSTLQIANYDNTYPGANSASGRLTGTVEI